MTDEGSQFDFDVFISFRHVDGRGTARSIRRWLQNWNPPADLGQQDKLRIFVDSYQGRPTSDYWANTIKPALMKSRWLIVVVTGSVMERLEDGSSNWVIREIETFLDTPQAENLIPVLAKSHASRPLPDIILDRFPRIQVYDFGQNDPLAPRIPFLENAHVFKLLAIGAAIRSIDGAGLERLRQEEQRRQFARLAGAGMLGTVGVGVILSLAIVAIVNGVEAIRTTAQSTLHQAARESAAQPDRAALLAANALRITSEPPILNWFLENERRWSRELLGTISLPHSVIRVPGGRISDIDVTDDGTSVIVLTEDGILAAYSAPDWTLAWSTLLSVDGPYEMYIARDHIFLSSYASERIVGFDLQGALVVDVTLPNAWPSGSLTLARTGFVLRWNGETGELSWLNPLAAADDMVLWEVPGFARPEAVAHAPDSRTLVVSTSTDEVAVYQQHLLETQQGLARATPALATNLDPTPVLVPSAGLGLRVSDNGETHLYSLADGTVKAALLINANLLYASEDGTVSVASVGFDDERVIAFDAVSGRMLRQPIGPFQLWSSPIFDSLGRRVALLGDGVAVILDDQPGGKTVTLRTPGQIMAGQFLEDEKLFALADVDGQVSIWDLETAQPVTTGIFHEEGSVKLATAAGGTLVSAGWDGTVRFTSSSPTIAPIWEIVGESAILDIDIDDVTQQIAYAHSNIVGLCTLDLRECEEWPVPNAVEVQFFNKGKSVLASQADNQGAMVVHRGTTPEQISNGPAAGARDDDLVAGVDAEQRLQIHGNNGYVRSCDVLKGLDTVSHIRMSSRGDEVLLVGQAGQQTRVKAIASRSCKALWSPDGDWVDLDLTNVNTLAIDETSGSVFVGGAGGGLLLSFEDGSVIREIEDRHVFNDVGWSRDGRILYSTAISRKVSAQTLEDGTRIFEALILNSIPWQLDLSAEGNRLAIANLADRHGRFPLQILDAHAGETLALIPHPRDLMDVQFAPDGTIVTANVDGVIRAWPTSPDNRPVDTILADVSRRTARNVERNGVIVPSPMEYAPGGNTVSTPSACSELARHAACFLPFAETTFP